MATGISGAAQFRNTYGVRVDRVTAALPQTGNSTLFTITGGRVLITTLVGEVTTAIQAQANAIQLLAISTVGSVSTALCASFESNGLALGSLLTIPGAGGTAVAGSSVVQNNELITQPGIIRLTTAASNTGSMRWTLSYASLDPGAAVVAS